jgi:hypothetical protein
MRAVKNMKSPRFPILRNRVRLVAALAFCVYETLPASITTLMKVPPNALLWNRDPAVIFEATVMMFFSVSIARKSTFVGDRAVFGIGAVSALLWAIRKVVLPGALVASIIYGFVHVLWAIGAVVALVLLISDKNASRQID